MDNPNQWMPITTPHIARNCEMCGIRTSVGVYRKATDSWLCQTCHKAHEKLTYTQNGISLLLEHLYQDINWQYTATSRARFIKIAGLLEAVIRIFEKPGDD